MNIVLSDEYAYFINKLKGKNKEYCEAGKRAGEACQETETFHDNPEWEGSRDDQYKASKQMGDIEEFLSGCKVLNIDDVILDGKVRIGTVISIENDGKEEVYKIGGVDTSGFNDRVSYKAPLIRPLIGKEIDDDVVIEIAGIKKKIVILGIKGLKKN